MALTRKASLAAAKRASVQGRRVVARTSAARSRVANGVVQPVAAPQPDVDEEEGSPVDFPEEYVPPQPSRRPDIFPEFEPMETPLPQPPPGDPELPDEFEWEEDEKKRKSPDKPDEEEEEEEEKEGGDDDEEEGLPAPQPSEE